MIRTVRAFFLSRALREELLLVAFILIGVLWWASAFTTRAGAFWREQRLTTSGLAEHAEWLKNKTTIEETAKRTASRLDPAKALNANLLVVTVSQLASEAGLNAQTSGGPLTKMEGQFGLHSQEFRIQNVEWDPLKKFYEALQQKSPYIAIERFSLLPLNTTGQHQLTFKVTSVEITR